MNVISNILFWISTGLLVPVIVLLIFFFIRALILIGGFMGQYMQTKKTTDILYKDIEKLSPQTLEAFEMKLAGQQPSVLKAFAEKIIANRGDKGKLELMLSEYEIEADKPRHLESADEDGSYTRTDGYTHPYGSRACGIVDRRHLVDGL